MKFRYHQRRVKKNVIRTVLLPVTKDILNEGTHSMAIGVAIGRIEDYIAGRGEKYFAEKKDVVKVVLRLREVNKIGNNSK